MIKIKALARKNPQKLHQPVKYYAGKVNQGEVNIDIISTLLSQKTTFSKHDINNILVEFTNIIPDLLEEGKIIRFGNLGSYCFSVHSTASNRPEDVSIENITKLKISFRPSKKLKERIERFPMKVTYY